MHTDNQEVITDKNGKKIIVLYDIRFEGRQNIKWNEVEAYLKQYINMCFKVVETDELIYVGKDLPDEYTGSKYTARLKGAYAKAKANAALGLPRLVETASDRRFSENKALKHRSDAKYGWYRYDCRFALPVFRQNGEIERYNVFQAELVIRYASDGKMYLYDLINIKKEASTPPEQLLCGQKLTSCFYDKQETEHCQVNLKNNLWIDEESERTTGERLVQLRKKTGMNRRQFAQYFDIPYRTMQDWELEHRAMPEYLLRLMAYKVHMENL